MEKKSILPESFEKQSQKFIFDSLKKKQTPIEEVKKVVEAQVQTLQKESLPFEKKFFRMGEAAQYLKVEPYILRYWEQEFSVIKPQKTKSGHRIYSRKDVENFLQIKQLLYVEKFSIEGAKKRLHSLRKKPEMTPEKENHKKQLHYLIKEIKELIQYARHG